MFPFFSVILRGHFLPLTLFFLKEKGWYRSTLQLATSLSAHSILAVQKRPRVGLFAH